MTEGLGGTVAVRSACALPSGTDAPRLARQAVRAFLSPLGTDEDVQFRAALLVSELVTNAVLHGGGVEEMWVEARPGEIRVGVVDRAAEREPEVVHAEPDEESGRGVHFVETFSSGWGVERDGVGKTVWFRLAEDAQAPELGAPGASGTTGSMPRSR